MNFAELNEKLKSFDVNDLNELDFNNMGSWPLAGRIVGCIIVFVGVLFFLYTVDISDKIDAYGQEVSRESDIKQMFESKAFKVANLDAYKQQLKEIEESFGSLLLQLPRDTEVPGLLEDITAAAKGASLEIKSIQLDKEIDTEFYTELPINIDVTGEYHDFGAFVSAVAGLSRIVTLHDFEVVSAGGGDVNLLNLKIVAKTYRYNDEVKNNKVPNNRKQSRKG